MLKLKKYFRIVYFILITFIILFFIFNNNQVITID
ncbi:MAG: SVM family protein [Phytoplasma sp.]|nr:SVM family protein [Phytoplasma sp.]WRH06742.1 MAG: SVM family protein [Phytoplasma sp.]